MLEKKLFKSERDVLKEAMSILLECYEDTEDKIFSDAYDLLQEILLNTGRLD